MTKLKSYLYYGIKNCANCGSYRARESLLCYICEENLFKYSCPNGIHIHKINNITCYSLFLWERDQNKILNKLIIELKGTAKKDAWLFYARVMYYELVHLLKRQDKLIIVPCPNFSQKDDHSALLAKGLSRFLDCEVIRGIHVKSSLKSKELSKVERLNNLKDRFEAKNEIIEKITGKDKINILFVDDVITTGATLLAMSDFYKEFQSIIGISLAFRR